MHCYTAETYTGLNEGVLPHASSTGATQSMIARQNASVVIKCDRMYSLVASSASSD